MPAATSPTTTSSMPRGDLLRRVGRRGEAATAYERALALATNDAERAFLARRLGEVRSAG